MEFPNYSDYVKEDTGKINMTNEKAIEILSDFDVQEDGTIEQHVWYHGIQEDTRKAIDIAKKVLDENRTITVVFGEGKLLLTPLIDNSTNTGILTINPIDAGEIGKEIEPTDEQIENPMMQLEFNNIASLDVLIKKLNEIRAVMKENEEYGGRL